jgi:hypothetical protein
MCIGPGPRPGCIAAETSWRHCFGVPPPVGQGYARPQWPATVRVTASGANLLGLEHDQMLREILDRLSCA